MGTGVAAAAANFVLMYSGYLPVLADSDSHVALNFNTFIVLVVMGIILALPLDRLIR